MKRTRGKQKREKKLKNKKSKKKTISKILIRTTHPSKVSKKYSNKCVHVKPLLNSRNSTKCYRNSSKRRLADSH
jgi:hypothetical protein